MRNPAIDWFYKALNLELPELSKLDAYVDYILPKIAPHSEDLYEMEFYAEKPWLEIRDDDQFLDAVLHIFKKEQNLEIKQKGEDDGRDYLRSIDGNVEKGSWTYLQKQSSNIILIKTSSSYELFEKVFINPDFFILKKHGYKHKSGNRKYFFMAREKRVKNLEWREIVELLYNIYRFRIRFILFLAGILVFVIIILFLSFI